MRPTAIVTGASRGLGEAIARHLAAAGWDLVIDARDAAALEAAAAGIEAASPGAVVARRGDVTDPRHRADLVEAAQALGRLELVVNNAGTLGPSPLPRLADLDGDALARALATNVVAPLGLTRAALADLRANRGTVVDITSDAAVEAYEGWGAYGASKAALEQLGRVLAAEEPGIRAYRLDPGDMNTRMHQDAFPGEDISDRADPDTRAPAVLRLVDERPPPGRYRAEDLLATAPARAASAGPAEHAPGPGATTVVPVGAAGPAVPEEVAS